MNNIRNIIITFLFASIYIIIAITARTNYSIIGPGEIDNITNQIKIEGIENKNNFNTVAVYEIYKPTAFLRMVYELNKDWKEESIENLEMENINPKDYAKMSKLSKESSYINSVISAYNEANLKDKEIKINYKFDGYKILLKPSNIKNIEIGNLVKKINGIELTENNLFSIFSKIDVGDRFTITLFNDNEEKNITLKKEKDKKFILIPYYNIISTTPKITFPGLNDNSGGASGGFIQALSIYSNLFNLDLKNLKIAGTGTINTKGICGPIGGVVQKLKTCEKNNVDIFFVPESNKIGLSKVTPKTNIKIIYVETLKQAIKYLEELI